MSVRPFSRSRLLVRAAVERDIGLGQVEQGRDLAHRKRFDAKQMAGFQDRFGAGRGHQSPAYRQAVPRGASCDHQAQKSQSSALDSRGIIPGGVVWDVGRFRPRAAGRARPAGCRPPPSCPRPRARRLREASASISVRVTAAVESRSSHIRIGSGERAAKLRANAPRRLRRRPVAAVHVERQADDQPADILPGDDRLQLDRIRRELAALERLHRRRHGQQRVRQREPDRLLAEIEAEQAVAGREGGFQCGRSMTRPSSPPPGAEDRAASSGEENRVPHPKCSHFDLPCGGRLIVTAARSRSGCPPGRARRSATGPSATPSSSMAMPCATTAALAAARSPVRKQICRLLFGLASGSTPICICSVPTWNQAPPRAFSSGGFSSSGKAKTSR